MAIKAKAHEKLDETNVERVLNRLQAEKPITKKEACEMLNISYNTTRLNNILAEYKERRDYRRNRMDQNKGKIATTDEIKEVIVSYLMGMNFAEISRSMYRSPTFVKNIVDRVGVPTKVAKGEKFIPPDECVKYEFEVGEWVWFNDNRPDIRGGKAGVITKDLGLRPDRRLGHAYKIDYWIPMEWQEGFWVAWWPGIKRIKGETVAKAEDLASIQHLVDEYDLNTEIL